MAGEPHGWYLLIGQEREGPFSTENIQNLLAEKEIDGSTFAWHEGLNTWTRLRELGDFLSGGPEHPAETEAGAKPTTPHDQAQIPNLATASASAAAGPMGILSGLPFLFTLAALLVALGAGGVYWLVGRGASQPQLPVESLTAAPAVRGLIDRIRVEENPQAEAALSRLGGRAVPELMNALVDSQQWMDPLSGRVRRVLIGIGPAAISPLLSYLTVGKAGVPVRLFAIGVLGGIGGLQVIPGLIGLLDDPSYAVQLQAMQTLSGLGPAAVPALVTQLTESAHSLSPKARKNLAQVIGQNADSTAVRALAQAQVSEKDPAVRQALTEALNHTSEPEPGRKSSPSQAAGKEGGSEASGGGPNAVSTSERPMGGAGPASAPPVNVQVHVSAEARVSVADEGDKKGEEKDPVAAAKRATQASEYLQRGELRMALIAYRQAYLLNPLPMYYLIILELEEALPDSLADSSREDTASVFVEEPPAAPVSLEELHEALAERRPNMDQYADTHGTWAGKLRQTTPLGWDAERELLLVQGETEGQDFVISLPPKKRRTLNLEAGDSRVWKGKVQGFRVIHQGENARTLPVLLVDEVE